MVIVSDTSGTLHHWCFAKRASLSLCLRKDNGMNATRVWAIQGKVLFPKAPLPLADRLEAVTRIPAAERRLPGLSIWIGPANESQPDLLHEWGRIAGIVSAEDPEKALEIGLPSLEGVLESMAFQMQDVLRIDSLEVLDVTPPVSVGDEREMLISPSPHGHHSIVFSPASVAIGGAQTRTVPDPWLQLIARDAKGQRALDWYLKSLATTLQVDQFIFLWIATEVLAGNSDASVEGNYVADCGHEIAECPQCGRSTARKLQGKSIQSFLQTDFNLTEELSRTAWQMRQMLHGAIDFQSKRLESLPELCGALRTGVLTGLKTALSIDAASPPSFSVGGTVSLIPGLRLIGSRAICEEDLVGVDLESTGS